SRVASSRRRACWRCRTATTRTSWSARPGARRARSNERRTAGLRRRGQPAWIPMSNRRPRGRRAERDRQDGPMAQVSVTARRVVHGSVEQVRAALADYQTTRPKILTEHYSDYEVRAGGQGAGSLVHWKLAATSKRVRDMLVDVTEDGHTLVES